LVARRQTGVVATDCLDTGRIVSGIEVGVGFRGSQLVCAFSTGAVLRHGESCGIRTILKLAVFDSNPSEVDHQRADSEQHDHHERDPDQDGATVLIRVPLSDSLYADLHSPHRILAVALNVFVPIGTNGIPNVNWVLVVTDA
jgi:hypothetical protein